MSKRGQLFDLWVSEPENDLLFECRLVAVDDGRQVVHASCCILAAGSEYFKNLFTSDGFRGKAKKIPVRGVRFAVLHQAVAFVMSDGEQLQLEEGNAAELLELGNRLQIQGLADKATAHLQEHLAPSNAAAAYGLASRHKREGLLAAAGEFIAAILTAVASQSPLEALQQLTVEHQLDILRQCTSDVHCSTAPLDWITLVRERGCTAVTLDEVVDLLRLNNCSADELLQLGRHKMAAQLCTLQLALVEQLHAKVYVNHCSLRPDPAICIDPAYAYTVEGSRKQAAVWRIADWSSKQDGDELISPPFCIQGVQGWTLSCYPKGNRGAGSHLSLYLRSPSGLTGDLPKLQYALFVANQKDALKTKLNCSGGHIFTANESSWGWNFLSLQCLATTPGFIVDDKLIVGVNAVFEV